MKMKLKSILAIALCAVGLSAFAAPFGAGTEDDPWKIGKSTAGDVEAWTNGTGRLEINAPDGESAMMDFDTSAPWAGAVVTESVVGSNVTAIGKNAFANCSSLRTLVLNEQTPPALGEGNDFNGVKIFVPAGAADAYRAAWPTLATQIAEMRTVKGDPLTKHLYEMTYNWWDATKANDIGEKLAALMEVFNWQEEQDDYFFPYQFFDWYEGFASRALCTSCRNGNFVGRNFDWGYDDVDECVMHIPAAEGRLASVGVASWFFPKEMQIAFDVDSFLPELTMDGVNEMGVAINVNVVPSGDNGWTTNTNPTATKRLNAGFAVRTVLDNATNAAHAVEILQSRNIYSLKPLEFHWMISDATESYVVECVSNALVVLKAHDARPKMSNYYVSHSPSVGEYDILTNAALTAGTHTPHAMGIERYANVSNGLESVESVDEMYTHMTNVWYKPKFLPGNELKYWSDLNGAPVPGKCGVRFEFGDETIADRYQDREKAFKEIQENYVAVTNYEAQTGFRTIDRTKHEWDWLTNEVVHTVHTSIYDIEKRMLRVVVQEDASYSLDVYLTPKQEISAVSAEGWLDLTVGDRVATNEETIVVNPAWGEAESATVDFTFGASTVETRTYDCKSNDLWQTTALTPGRYTLALTAGATNETAAFWKTGADWVVLDLPPHSTEGIEFQADTTYLALGQHEFAPDKTLTVLDGAKFEYAPGAGFKGGKLEAPRRYAKVDVGDGLYQIVEKIKGSKDNPWDVGVGVEAYTNGTDNLVIVGAGTIADLSEIPADVKGGIAAITVGDGVTDAAAGVFFGFDGITVTLQDNWKGELPDEKDTWCGATNVELTRVPTAVKNVKVQQRYPWNGKVDVDFDLTGEGDVKVTVQVTVDGEKLKNPTVDGETTFDLGKGKELKDLRLTWDAKADFGDAEKHEKIKVKLTVEKAEVE